MPRVTLARRLTITELVRVYEEAVAKIRVAYAELQEAEIRLNDAFRADSCRTIRVTGDRYFALGDRAVNDALLAMRHDVWQVLIERLELRRMMSATRWQELQRQVERRELPEVTERSVSDFVTSISANLDVMLAEAIEEVFDWLRPRRSKYKQNSEYEVPRKIVLMHVVEPWGKLCSSWRVNHYRTDEYLTALENVFSALDGRGQITKTHYSAISSLIRDKAFTGHGETPYFAFKTYKNGNMHLEFRRLDLLARFNAIAGGRRLRSGATSDE
jgi:hypothetical protein